MCHFHVYRVRTILLIHISLCHSLYSAVIALFFTCVELPVLVGSARPKFVVSLPQLKEGSGELDMENYVQV